MEHGTWRNGEMEDMDSKRETQSSHTVSLSVWNKQGEETESSGVTETFKQEKRVVGFSLFCFVWGGFGRCQYRLAKGVGV